MTSEHTEYIIYHVLPKTFPGTFIFMVVNIKLFSQRISPSYYNAKAPDDLIITLDHGFPRPRLVLREIMPREAKITNAFFVCTTATQESTGEKATGGTQESSSSRPANACGLPMLLQGRTCWLRLLWQVPPVPWFTFSSPPFHRHVTHVADPETWK